MSVRCLVGSSRAVGQALPRTRLFITSITWSRYSSTESAKQRIDIKHLGVGTDIYVHPSSANIPYPWINPRLAFRSVIRRIRQFGQNTLMVGQFRWKSKISPRFVEWKNLALETYVSVNQAFAKRNLDLVDNKVNIWVKDALQKRLDGIPKGTMMEWQLIKFKSNPRVVSFQPMMLPNTPLKDVQIVYRIESQQRLIRVLPGQSKAEKVDRNVTDYVAFIIDTSQSPARVLLSGTLFETPLNSPIPKSVTSPNKMMASMREKGDIFRQPPVYIPQDAPSN